MSTAKRRVFNKEFKLSTVRRVLGGASVAALSRELKISERQLFQWLARFRAEGGGGLRRAGRPRKSQAKLTPGEKFEDLAPARERISDLERKIGQQQVQLDF